MKIITNRLDVIGGFVEITTYLNEPDVEDWKEFCALVKSSHPDLDKLMVKEEELFGLRVTIFKKGFKTNPKPIDSNAGIKKEKKKIRGDDFDIDFDKYEDTEDFYSKKKR